MVIFLLVFLFCSEMAEAERLTSRRALAQIRIEQHSQKLLNQEKAREQVAMHRIKMVTLAEREAQARQMRQLGKIMRYALIVVNHTHTAQL